MRRIDYSEDTIIWERTAETNPTKNYVFLEKQALDLALREEQYLTYFLDGLRRVYKVDDHAYIASGGRSVIYPIVAGQIGVGCCKRENKIIKPERFMREIVISYYLPVNPLNKMHPFSGSNVSNRGSFERINDIA